MTQAEVKAVVDQAYQDVFDAYYATKDQAVTSELFQLQIDLGNLKTLLNRKDLESRTANFVEAQKSMSAVLPGIKRLDEAVARLLVVEDVTKTALTDLFKVSQCVSFFKIPAL